MASALLQAAVVVGVCWSLSPLNTQTVLSATSEYVLSTGFGPYDRIVFSHVHQRPFEICKEADKLHAELLDDVAKERAAIDASSRFEIVRVARLVRAFNRKSQTFYASQCPGDWSYFYSYVDYQSSLMKVAPAIWVVDALHRSEIYIVVALILGSWFGIFSLFWVAKKLTGSTLVGFASLGVLWFSLSFFGQGLYADSRLNLLNTFALVGVAQFLCDLPHESRWRRRWAIEVAAALVFAAYAMILTFPRLPSTRLDATVVMICIFAVAVIRLDRHVLRRAILVLVVVTASQWPYRAYSSGLLGPVAAVNTAEADEYKTVNAVQFLTERPGHFGNFILDFNFTWIFDGDYYLRQLSPVPSLHHGYPAWGRRFLKETAIHHVTEFPNAWWKRFLIQLLYHKEFSFGIYRGHEAAAAAVLWLAVPLMLFIVFRGRPGTSAWPLVGLVMWEVCGLHTFLGLMHVHPIYLLKGVPLLWCALPSIVYVSGREAVTMVSRSTRWSLPGRPKGLALGVAVVAGVGALAAGGWAVREFRKELHATRVWRAVHVGQYYRDAYLSPDDLVREVDAIRDLGGDDPGTVSMYGAWALYGYRERLAAYNQFASQPISLDHVKQLEMNLYRRALAEGPDNPHLYTYAQYFEDPNRLKVFRTALDRFPDHPYAVMLSYFVLAEDSSLTVAERHRYQVRYEEAVRRQLRDSASFRPSLRELPAVVANSPAVPVPDGMFVTLLPGEVAKVESFRTFGTDRMALGVFLKVTEGQVTVQLDGQPRAKLLESAVITPADPVAYRAWHFTNLDASPASSHVATTALELRAGPQGARFIIRDLYPLVENPRWFR